jgi:ABC-2 type transport system permease protein
MSPLPQYLTLVKLQLQMLRNFIWFIGLVQAAFIVGFVYGFGYFIPGISETGALYITTGAAANAIVTVALVGLPQYVSEAKAMGRFEYFLTLPISRELYILAIATTVVVNALPGVVLALLLGSLNYGLTLEVSPWVIVVVPLAIASMAGFGVAIAVLSPHQQLTNAITQLLIFYVILFAPIMMPESQLPVFFRAMADFFPTTYVADAVRATLTDLEGTNLARSLFMMAAFALLSLAASSVAVRRRG